MMKKALILLIAVSFHSTLTGQIDTRILRHSNSNFSICTSICHLDQALYLNLGSNSSFWEWTNEQWLYKLDFNLNTLDSIKLNDLVPTYPGDQLRLIDIEPNNDLLHLILNIQNGQITTPFGDQYRSILIRLNSNLELIDFAQFGNDSTATGYGQIGFCNNGKIILGGTEYSEGAFWKPSVIKLDQNLQVERLAIFDSLPESRNGLPFFINKLSVIDDQILASTLPVSNLKRKAILALDSSLNMQGYGSINTTIDSKQASLYRGLTFTGTHRDSLYAIAILNWLDANGQREFALGIAELDSNYNIGTIDTAQTSKENSAQVEKNPYLYFEPTSFESLDSLIIVANDNAIDGFDYYSKDSNTFFLYNYNLRKNSLNWRKEIKTGLTNAWHSVEAIPGNRYVLAFSQYDWITNSSPDLEVHLWVLDENGAILNQVELHKPMSLATAYPNPCYNEIDIPKELTQDRGLNYLIINQQGLEVQNGSLKKGSTKIDVSRLPQACYYLLTEHGNVKIIKK